MLQCRLCSSEMRPMTRYSLGTPIAVLGWLLFLGPSIVMLLGAGAIVALGSLSAGVGTAMDGGSTGGSVAASAAVGGVGLFVVLGIFGPGLLIGLLLTMKRRVVACVGCGTTADQVPPDHVRR